VQEEQHNESCLHSYTAGHGRGCQGATLCLFIERTLHAVAVVAEARDYSFFLAGSAEGHNCT
jgi:hypothetical protein